MNELYEFNEFNDFFKVGEVGVLKPLKSVILDRGKGELLGLNISINGRIGKADRSKGIKWHQGKIKKNSLSVFTHSSNYAINTKTGVWMLKVSLLRI